MSETPSDLPPEVESRIWSMFDEFVAALDDERAARVIAAKESGFVSAAPREDDTGTQWVVVTLTSLDGGADPLFEITFDDLVEGL